MTSSLPSKFEVILASSKCFISSKNFVFVTPNDVNYRIISMDDDVDLRVAISYIVKSRNLGFISGNLMKNMKRGKKGRNTR